MFVKIISQIIPIKEETNMQKTISFDLTGRTAVVTGGSRGLGIELATSLAEYGADIALMAGNEEKMKKVAEGITEKTGRRVICVKVNIADEDSVNAAVAKVMDEYGKIDILVNNAGIIRYGSPEAMESKDFREVMDVDVIGTWMMSKAVVNASMLPNHYGKIININSVNSFSASPVAPAYHVAKAAEYALTKSCAAAWAQHGIYVNGIAPGNMQNGEMAPDTPADILENIRRKVPQKRLGRYGDLSGALLYLASDASSYTQGVTITCDGGLILECF